MILIDENKYYTLSQIINTIIKELDKYDCSNNLKNIIKCFLSYIDNVKINNHELIINLNCNGLFKFDDLFSIYLNQFIIDIGNENIQFNNNMYLNYNECIINKIKRIE